MQADPSPQLQPRPYETRAPLNAFGSLYEWRWFGVILVAAVAAVAVLSGVLLV